MNQGIFDVTQYLKEAESVERKKYELSYPGASQDNYFYQHGLVEENDDTFHMEHMYAIRLTVDTEHMLMLQTSLDLVRNRSPKPEAHTYITKTCYLDSGLSQTVTLPIKEFSLPKSEEYYLRFVRGISFVGNEDFQIKQVTFINGSSIGLECSVRSQPVDVGEAAVYEIWVANCENYGQTVSLEQKRYGWEALEAVLMVNKLWLAPGETKKVNIKVNMNARICPGGYEEQTIIITPGGRGDLSQSMTFSTVRYLSHPHVLMDCDELEQVKTKIDRCQWARDTYEQWMIPSVEWQVPEIEENRKYLFLTRAAHEARGAATMYQLSGDRSLGIKVVDFLKKLSDSEKGYLKTWYACSQELVHEGEFFKSTAIAYDMVYDFPELTKEDHQRMEEVLRKAIEVFDGQLNIGQISNWTLAEICGGLYCACVLQDRVWIDRFLYGVGGAVEHLSKGTFADGWWFETSVGYNLLCAGLLCELSQVVSHYGINFKDIKVPANYSVSVNSANELKDGLVCDNWGINDKNYRTIPMLWDSLVPFYDYRGVIFGINDSSEMKVEGVSKVLYDSRFDMAYYLYGKPEYAQLMRNADPARRDLLFGAETFPEIKEEAVSTQSCYADNAGVAVLRSKTANRENREQIQVGLKYGSHGGAHGHYDRVSMTSLMRYGRSLTGPENVWYSYHTMMYKFYVQNSVAHNMVTVDLKLQDPVEPKRLMFYSGCMMQAIALENHGRWSHPAYGGWQVGGDKTLKERSWNEGRYIPIPENPPEYCIRTEFTEPVLTRRMTVVTDDFIVNFDYGRGETEHNFDCLYHLQGLTKIEGANWTHHSQQLDENPLSSGQFITDCDWYEMKGGGLLNFEVEFTETKNNGNEWMTDNKTSFNEYGIVNTNLYLAYPPEAVVLIGSDPEYQGVNKQLFYQLNVDGEVVADGQFGAWILGRDEIDLDISGKKELKLKVRIKPVAFEGDQYLPMLPTIFWGNPTLELEDGTVMALADLPLQYEHVNMGHGIGMDYEGGPVKIQGKLFDKAIPAEPDEPEAESVITVRLDQVPSPAKHFYTSVGGDYRVGEEHRRRRTIAFRQSGISARFITVLEPVEHEHMVVSVKSENQSCVRVTLKDGREVLIEEKGLDSQNCNPSVIITEYQNGTVLRREEG